MEEAAENGKESSHSAHGNGMNEWNQYSFITRRILHRIHLHAFHRKKHNLHESQTWLSLMTNNNYRLRKVKTCNVEDHIAGEMSFCVVTTKYVWNRTTTIYTKVIKTQQLRKPEGACSYCQKLSVNKTVTFGQSKPKITLSECRSFKVCVIVKGSIEL
jgi:hypothetical protein